MQKKSDKSNKRTDAVRTDNADGQRTESTVAGSTAQCGGHQPKVFNSRTCLNDGLKLLTDAEVMVLGDRGEWRKAHVTAFWDTGSTWTAISKTLADRLGARLAPSNGVEGIGSWQESWLTVINLRLGDIVIPMERVEVVDYQGSMRPDLVIGMTTILKGHIEMELDGDDMVLRFEL